MKSLVTGGAGFLGSHLVDALVERGERVTVIDNLKRGSLNHLSAHVDAGTIRILGADIRDYEAILAVMNGMEVVYHLAAQSNVIGSFLDPDYSFSTNVVGTYNVLKAASTAGVRRVVFASSREVYGQAENLPVAESAPIAPRSAYGASKIAGEAYCRVWSGAKDLECQVVRLANIYGPRDYDRVIPRWIERARRDDYLELYGGDQVLDFLWSGHAVAALLAAARCPLDGPINVGSSIGIPLAQLARRILELTGSRSGVRVLPGRPGEVARFIADVGKMRKVLNVHPEGDPLEWLACLTANTVPSIESSPCGMTAQWHASPLPESVKSPSAGMNSQS